MDVLAAHGHGAPPVPRGYRDLVREQLHQWRERRDAEVSEVGPADGAGGQVLSVSQLLSVARMLQGDDPSPYARVLVGDDRRQLGDVIRDELLRGLRELGVDPDQSPLRREDEEALDAAARALADAVRRGALGRLTVQTADGSAVLGSTDPLAEALTRAGFTMTPRGLRLRPSGRP